jgi:hypothetical protein
MKKNSKGYELPIWGQTVPRETMVKGIEKKKGR